MTLVVDASVALKLVLPEEDVEAAKRLLRVEPAIAPQFLLLESANVLAQTVRRGFLTPDEATAGLKLLTDWGMRLVPDRLHVSAAHRLAVELQRSAYDCLYLAVALEEGATLITADARFFAAAADHPRYRTVVQRL